MEKDFKHKKITIEAYGKTYTLEGDWTNIDDWEEVFTKVLYCVGFEKETIKELFAG